MDDIIRYFMLGGPVMWPMLAISLILTALTLERYYTFSRLKVDVYRWFNMLKPLIEKKKFREAIDLCNQKNAPLPNIFKAMIERSEQPRADIDRAVSKTGAQELLSLEKYLSLIVTLISAEPMLGFLGTITGLIKAFQVWASMGAKVSINQLASGMYEAMITTAFGLFLAVPFTILYNHLNTRVKVYVVEMETHGEELLEFIEEQKQKQASQKSETSPTGGALTTSPNKEAKEINEQVTVQS